jgi:hypothetical protein
MLSRYSANLFFLKRAKVNLEIQKTKEDQHLGPLKVQE